MMTIRRLSAHAAILLALSPAIVVAGGNAPGQGPAAFESYDRDADGYVSAQEFDQARAQRIQQRAEQGGQFRNLDQAPTFGAIDADGDGRLSREEMRYHHQQRFENRWQAAPVQGGQFRNTGQAPTQGGGRRQ